MHERLSCNTDGCLVFSVNIVIGQMGFKTSEHITYCGISVCFGGDVYVFRKDLLTHMACLDMFHSTRSFWCPPPPPPPHTHTHTHTHPHPPHPPPLPPHTKVVVLCGTGVGGEGCWWGILVSLRPSVPHAVSTVWFVDYLINCIHIWHKNNPWGKNVKHTISRWICRWSRTHRQFEFLLSVLGYPSRSLIYNFYFSKGNFRFKCCWQNVIFVFLDISKINDF